MNAATVQFVKLVVQPILILGGINMKLILWLLAYEDAGVHPVPA